ncbi:4-hydroxy-tetrahydrodipicolinate reductase [Kiloniella sp. b19]|uniref:4-hydroxy-tetrahydrodipicolinate reductase n=1 Tax=Kiloniella sp. GXU_MW_B19 TaxID=3141326 RepID=UPI0031D84BF1
MSDPQNSSSFAIGIAGCGGRMGRMLVSAVVEAGKAGAAVRLAGGSERQESGLVGRDLGEMAGIGALGVQASDDLDVLFSTSDVVIDFTAPVATTAHAKLAARHGTGLVIGTTGMTEADLAVVQDAARQAPIVFARNMSLGVNLLLSLVQQVSAALDEDYDIEVLEMHHRHKVDAPSGTALALGEAAATGRGVDLDAVADKVRDGITGERKRGDIGFATLRGGDVVGDHSVIFAAEGERIEIGHRASNRQVFSRGAVKAAFWLQGRAPGFYDMQDVLGLKKS